MPGGPALAAELGIDGKTVWAAMQLLEQEGLLVGQGAGRARRIVPPKDDPSARALRVAILVGERSDLRLDYMVNLQHQLSNTGHDAFFPPRTLAELGMNPSRISGMVEQTGADAWVVMAASNEVLEWFAAHQPRVYALFGRRRGLRIAGGGPDKPPAFSAATRRLVGLGHRRIVMLSRSLRRLPEPGASERAFLDELKSHGVPQGDYNLPDWEESAAGFHERLESLFHHSPPTALIIEEGAFLVAAMQFCASRGIRVPEDLSLICTDPDPAFSWCKLQVAHIRWDARPVVRSILGWAANLSLGRDDRRQNFTEAEFVEGGTVGPAPA
jgi:DNA-binding LacI/PurR family transcriptional regulator